MDAFLKLLAESNILSDDTKTQLTEHFDSLKVSLRESIEAEVRAELAEQHIAEREQLATKMETFVSESLTRELSELQEEIAKFRDLEAEYETRLVDTKVAMAEELIVEKAKLKEAVESEIETLIDLVSVFLEDQLSVELEALKEDIQEVKNNRLGQEMFETFAGVFMKSHLSKTGIMKELEESRALAASLQEQVTSLTESNSEMLRESKMTELLSNLSGSAREEMAFLLKGVATERLDETYSQFVSRVLNKNSTQNVIVESQQSQAQTEIIKTGTAPKLVTEGKKMTEDEEFRFNLQRQAGII